MAEDTLVYVTGRKTSSIGEIAAADLILGETQLSSQSGLVVTPFSTGLSGGIELTPVSLFDWQNVKDGAWAVRKKAKGHVTVVPLENLTPAQRLPYITSDVLSFVAKNPNDARAVELGRLAAETTTSTPLGGPLVPPALKGSSATPNGWTAAPAPHWAYVSGEEQSEPDSEGVSHAPPEMGKSESYLRIGAVSFIQAIGPLDMQVSITPQLESSPGIRQATEMKRIGGVLRKTISFSMLFTNESSVRGELMPFLRQSRRAPFIPVVHSGLLHQHGITAIAVQSCSLATVPEHPGCLQLNVVCFPFPEERYLLDGDILDACVNYPLLEMWLASDDRYYQDNYGTASLASQKTQEDPFQTPVWNGQIALSTPNRDWLDLINENETPAEQKLSRGQAASDSLENAAHALSGDAGALSKIAPTTQESAKDIPVTTIRDFYLHEPNDGGNPRHMSGAWVAIQVTPDVAPYAFLPQETGGPELLLQNWSYRDADLVGTTIGKTFSEERTNLAHGQGIAGLSGQYLALWHVGTKYTLPKSADGEPIMLSDGIEVAAQKALLDPNNPKFTIPVDLHGFTIESVSAGMSNSLAEIAPGDSSTPEYQIMGSSDVSVEFSGICDVTALGHLYSILYEISALAVEYRGTWDGTPYGGYCKIDNEIAQILGMQYAIPTRLSIDTIDNFPTHRRVTISFVNFNPIQRKLQLPSDYDNSKGSTLPTSVQSESDYLDRAAAVQAYEQSMQKIELYPDIQPPSWKTLQTWCRDIKNGRVWDEGDDKTGRQPGPLSDYSFLVAWPYSAAWLNNHASEFMEQPLPYADGEEAPDGYVDPDFWCCGRGAVDQPTGQAFVEDMLHRLHSEEAETVYTSSDGVTTSVRQGTNGMIVSSDSKSMGVIKAHQDSAKGDGMDPKNPHVRSVPYSARNTTSSINITTAPGEPQVGAGLGTPLPINTAINSEETFYHNLGPTWKSGNKALKAGAVLNSAKRMGIPLALVSNMMLTESNNDNLVDKSSTGAKGPIQSQPQSFREFFPRAVREGLIPVGTPQNMDDYRQTAACGAVEYKSYYENGYRAMEGKGLSDPERQFYAWQYASAAYYAGEGHISGVRQYLKNGGDPRLLVQNIKDPFTKNAYVPNIFGHGPQVRTGEINLQSFQGGSLGQAQGKEGFIAGNGAYYPPSSSEADFDLAVHKYYEKRNIAQIALFKKYASPTDGLMDRGRSDRYNAAVDAYDKANPGPTRPTQESASSSPAPAPPAQDLSFGQQILKGAADSVSGFSKGVHGFVQDDLGAGDHEGSFHKGLSSSIPDAIKGIERAALGDGDSSPSVGYEQIHKRAWDYERAAYDPENGEDIFWAARRYDLTGRLLRAYPSQCILLVDGGKWIGFHHLTDLFYGLHSAMDITCYTSRLTPADSCVVSFADPYGNLSSQAADVELNKRSSTQRNFNIDDIFKGLGVQYEPNDDIKLRRSEELKSLLVKPGNRLHVRLGYGSNAAELPVCFNGVVSSVEKHADTLTVTGLGDGYELTSQLSPTKAGQSFYEKVGAAGGGMEVRDIILDILATGEDENTARVLSGVGDKMGPVISGVTAAITNGFGQKNPWGIEHFGDVIRNTWLVADCAEIGINIYSGWGDQPVNVTVAAESGPLGLIAQAVDGGAGARKVVDHIDDYNDPKNKEHYDGMGTNEFWRCLQGEELVGIRMENATPWQVVNALRLACLDYVVAVEHFGLRSTLFFGKDWWPLHYQYDYDYINTARTLPPEDAGKDATRVRAAIEAARVKTAAYTDHAHAKAQIEEAQNTSDETQNVEPVYRRRPFLQVHVCHSGTNLIASEIDCTAEGWYRSVQATGSYAGTVESEKVETSLVQYLDSDIYPQFQNMKLVQSGLYSTEHMRQQEIIGANALNVSQTIMSTNVLNNYAVGSLHDEVREMYQGNVYQTGNGYLRPRHMVHLVDAMRQIAGPVEVKEVTHTFGMGGFITTWTPDCVATAMDTQKFPLITHALQFGSRYCATKGILAAARSEAGSYVLRRGLNRSLSGLAKLDEIISNVGGAGLRYVAHDLKRMGGGLLNRTPLSKVGDKIGRFKEIDGLPIDRREVLHALEQELEGWNRVTNAGRHNLRVTKHAILKENREEITQRIADRLYGTKHGGETRKIRSALSAAEQKQVDAYINKVLYDQGKYFGLFGGPTLKAIDDTAEARAALNKPSYVRWVAERIDAKYTPLQGTLLDLFKSTDIFREANNRIARPQIKVATLKYFQDIVGDRDVALHDALERTIGKSADSDSVDVKLFRDTFAQRITEAEEALKTRKAAHEAATTANKGSKDPALVKAVSDEEKAIAKDEVLVKRAKATLKNLKFGTKSAKNVGAGLKKAAGLVKFGSIGSKLGKFAGVGKVAGKIIGGPWELLLQVVIGAATTQLNRYLASRQALKIFPLQSCHKEWTAGINGHLGSVAGDPLGPADKTIQAVLGSGTGSLQNYLVNDKIGTLFGLLIGGPLSVGIGKVADANGMNATATLVGLNDPHYNTDDGAYHELMGAYGFPKPQEESTADAVARTKQQLQRLADMNEIGLKAATTTHGSNTPTGTVGADGQVVPAGPGDSYISRTNSIAGQRYSRVVRDLALYITDRSQNSKPPADREIDNDLAPGRCQARMVRVMNAEGLDSTSYYPHNSYAYEAEAALQRPPYSQYWQKVIQGPIAVSSKSIPNGALCYFKPNHVAIVVRYGERVFLIGNTDGNQAEEVTYSNWKVSSAFLPK